MPFSHITAEVEDWSWRLKGECFPFEDDENYYITVNSEYETPGNEKEKRLSEAVLDGVYKLLKFYGKEALDPYGLSRESSAKEYFVSLRPCVRMKVLVAVPKSVFDSIGDDPTACNINKPEEGYLSAFIPLGQVAQKIDTIVSEFQSLKMDLIRSDKFISNVNIDREIKRLKTAKRAIQRYIKLNNIAPVTLEDPECFDPKQVSRDLELGFTYDYKAAFALVGTDQYTIGYSCFLETSVLNHITTINYLTRLDLMLADLVNKYEASFNVFDFLSKHTLPIPIIETKQDVLDGVDKYDEDGNLFSFANIAKLITLDLDINLCKTDEERAKEEQELLNAETKRLIAEAAKDTSEFVGNNKTGAKGVADLKAKLEFISPINRIVPRTIAQDTSSGNWKLLSWSVRQSDEETNYIGYQESAGAPPGVVIGERIDGAFIPVVLEERLSQFYAWAQAPAENGIDILYNDVMAKVNLGCVLEETIQCLLENMITSFGEAAFNDPDLEKVFRLQDISLGGFNKNCELDRCDGTPDIDLKIGFPVFQGLNIPSNFPTLDFLAGTIDQAIKGLYNALVSALSSLILGVLNGLCELLFSLPDGLAGIGEGFKSWLSKSLGVDIDSLSDPEAWAAALTSTGGTGFIGVIGKAASNIEGSLTDAYTETGLAINWPNPETGQVEEKFISPEFLVSMMSNVSSGVETVETILTPTETQSVYMGIASPETITLCYNCLSRNGNSLFQSEQDVEDVFSGIGKLLKPQFLLDNAEDQNPTPSNVCDVGDGSDMALIRAAYLQNKDPDLPPEEIEEIINKEKAKKKTKVLKALETLENFQAGNLAPAFPNIFGDGGLIPEAPPVISEISNIIANGALAPAVINFSADASYYSELWGQLFGVDAEGEALTELGASPRELYGKFDGSITYNQKTTDTDIIYKFGYLESLAENVTIPDADSSEEIDILGGKETVILQNFGKNFKKDEFRTQLATEFFDGNPNKSPDVFDGILNFLEDKDEENGTHLELFYDPENPLISYSVVVYHEGGLTDVGTDRLTEAILIKTEHDPVDQPITKEIVYDYGEFFGTRDKSALGSLIQNTSWEGPLKDSSADQDNIVKLANNDLAGFVGGMIVGAGAGTGAGLLLVGPMTTGLAGVASGLYTASATAATLTGGGISSSSAIVSAISAAGGPITIGIALAIFVAISLIAVYYDGKDIAKRIIFPDAQDGFVYAYDVVVSDKEEKVTITERKIDESLITRGGVKSPGWPSDIVTLTKGSGTGIAEDVSQGKTTKTLDMGSMTQYSQDYFFDSTGVGIGLKVNDESLSPTSYSYQTNEDINYGISGLNIKKSYPLSATSLSNMVEDSLAEFFTKSSDAQVIEEISKEIRKQYKQLNFSALFNLIETVRDEPNRQYWSPGYSAGFFNNITLGANILEYDSLKAEFVSFNNKLLNATFKSEYCDNISSLRRSNASQALILLIRLYMVEQAAINIQVFNKFDLAFMDSNIFSSNIVSLMKTEMYRYQLDFQDVGVNLYQQLLNAAEKYYEALSVINKEEPVQFSKKSEYLEDLIKKEVSGLKTAIVNNLKLGQNWRTWDGFVTERMFPVFDTPSNAASSLKTEPPISAFGDEPEFEFTAKGPTPFELDTSYEWFSDMKAYYGKAVPELILDQIGGALEAWIAPVYKGGEGIPGVDLPTLAENELEGFVTETIGDVQYTYEYYFKVDGYVEGDVNTTTKYTGKIIVRGAFTDDYLKRITDDAILNPFYDAGGGFAFETYVKYAPKGKTYTIDGVTNFLSLLKKDIEEGKVSGNKKLMDTYDYIRFGYRMVYVGDPQIQTKEPEDGSPPEYSNAYTNLPSLFKKLSDIDSRSNKQKAFALTQQVRSINGATDTYQYVSIPLVSAECEYVDTTTTQDITIQQFLDTIESKYSNEIYANIKGILTETDEYKRLTNLVLPIKDLISSISFYQYASLSDKAVFLNSINGINLHNISSRAKLSTLQTFYASIYGEGKISYEDPFSKNL
jgi:hypothetical protein